MELPETHLHYNSGYISVIGAGSWGTTLAALLAEKEYDVTLWSYEREVAAHINKERINPVYLPGVLLPENLKATSDLEEAVGKARYIVSVVPTQHIRAIFSPVKSSIRNEALVVSASKGLEIATFKTPSMVLQEILEKPAAALSGPSFAKEVIAKLPTAVTLAAEDRRAGLMLQEIFTTDYFRVYTHDDVIGAEIGGALKNVIAIAAGISDGLGLGNSAKSALITRGLAEIVRLGISRGAKEVTFSGLSGIGDLVLTCNSLLSRNYTVGYRLGKGESLDAIAGGTKSVAEGVSTARAAHEYAARYTIDIPITEQVYSTLYQGKSPAAAVKDLMSRSLKSEFYGY